MLRLDKVCYNSGNKAVIRTLKDASCHILIILEVQGEKNKTLDHFGPFFGHFRPKKGHFWVSCLQKWLPFPHFCRISAFLRPGDWPRIGNHDTRSWSPENNMVNCILTSKMALQSPNLAILGP